jgi:hypothetical protein
MCARFVWASERVTKQGERRSVVGHWMRGHDGAKGPDTAGKHSQRNDIGTPMDDILLSEESGPVVGRPEQPDRSSTPGMSRAGSDVKVTHREEEPDHLRRLDSSRADRTDRVQRPQSRVGRRSRLLHGALAGAGLLREPPPTGGPLLGMEWPRYPRRGSRKSDTTTFEPSLAAHPPDVRPCGASSWKL